MTMDPVLNEQTDAAAQGTLEEVHDEINASTRHEEDNLHNQYREEETITNEEISSRRRRMDKERMTDGYANSSTPLPLKDKATPETPVYYTLVDIAKPSNNVYFDSNNYTEIQCDSIFTSSGLQVPAEAIHTAGSTGQYDNAAYYT